MAYTRHLGQNGFRGVDFTSHPSLVHPDRFADALNVWKDYKSGQGSAIETFPGFNCLIRPSEITYPSGETFGIFKYTVSGKEYIIAHVGENLSVIRKTDEGYSYDKTIYSEMNEAKSSGFQFGDRYYIIDGKNYICISLGENGIEAKKVQDEAYVPTTFINGVEHEQRNMLIDEEYQEYNIRLAISKRWYGADIPINAECEFEYTTFYDSMNCTLSKIVSIPKGIKVVFIPEQVQINGKTYTVTRIGDRAFSGIENISTVILPKTVHTIGVSAFSECPDLSTVYGEGVEKIEDAAFYFSKKFNNFYGTYGVLKTIEDYAFWENLNYTSGVDIHLNGYSSGSGDPTNITIGENVKIEDYLGWDGNYPTASCAIPIYSPFESIESIKIGDEVIDKNSNGYVTFTELEGYIVLEVKSLPYAYEGKNAKITVKTDPQKFSSSKYTPFLSSQSGYGGTALQAVLGCTKVEHFDGRVFFTGNPHLPNTVFYTNRDNTGHNNPFYIGTYNYFDTGIGQTPNTAMIASGSYLYVLKGDTIQDGSINLYQGVDGTDNILPRFYVRQQGLAGVGCLGAACNFADDPVFISKRGLEAIGLQTVNLERTVQHRSTNVDRRLMQEDLSKAQLAEWEGYLVLLVPGGKVYLADSRQVFTGKAGYHEYEWYYLDGFCSYTDDETVYAFSSALPLDENGEPMEIEVEGHKLCIYETPDAIFPDSSQVYDMYIDDTRYFYVEIDDTYYLVYQTGEKTGGTKNEATCIVSFGDELYFGTSNGDVCVINTDKRGMKPLYSDMSDDDYKAQYSDIISREWYNHMNHRYTSFVYLAQENAGVPHMSKNTVKKSVVLKAKDIFGSLFKWNVKTDRVPFGDVAEIAASMPEFDEMEFGMLVLDTTRDGSIIVINEKQKRYVEKQYAFFSDEYCRPFGIYHISYQYEIQGKVKNR